MYRPPTIRERDAFLGSIGVDIWHTNIEAITVTDGQGFKYKDKLGEPIATMYYLEYGDTSSIAIHWPETPHAEMT